MKKMAISFLLFVFLCLAAALGSSKNQGAPEYSKTIPSHETTEEFVEMNFQDVDILVFISHVSELTGTNFVIDPRVKGTVTTVAPEKVHIDEVLDFFYSVLDVHGYTMVDAGGVCKIIPSATAAGKSIETKVREVPKTSGDKMVTQVIHLNYISPVDAKNLLTPLIPESSTIISHPQSGSLIVTDTDSNIRRLQQIIEAIDIPTTQYKIKVNGE